MPQDPCRHATGDHPIGQGPGDDGARTDDGIAAHVSHHDGGTPNPCPGTNGHDLQKNIERTLQKIGSIMTSNGNATKEELDQMVIKEIETSFGPIEKKEAFLNTLNGHLKKIADIGTPQQTQLSQIFINTIVQQVVLMEMKNNGHEVPGRTPAGIEKSMYTQMMAHFSSQAVMNQLSSAMMTGIEQGLQSQADGASQDLHDRFDQFKEVVPTKDIENPPPTSGFNQ